MLYKTSLSRNVSAFLKCRRGVEQVNTNDEQEGKCSFHNLPVASEQHRERARGTLTLGLLCLGCPTELLDEMVADVVHRLEKCNSLESQNGWVDRTAARKVLLGHSSDSPDEISRS